jgi:hypothetical protein
MQQEEKGKDKGIKKPEPEKIAQEAIEEARMVLPGIQTIFGFQLIAVFNNKFADIPEFDRMLHYAAMLLIALAMALIMTPAAYHRQVEPGTVSDFFVKLASLLITAAMLPLMLALSLDIYVTGNIILGSVALSGCVAGILLLVFGGLWYVFPWAIKRT